VLVEGVLGTEETRIRLRRLSAAARASRQLAEDDRLARDGAIGEADAAGWQLREIARETRLSTGHVLRIAVAAETERQQAAAGQPEND
jgi:hypothetical protein